jgi:gluconate 2-dehydrogenase gamma chain
MNRREALRLLAAAPLIGTLEWLPEEVSSAALKVDALARRATGAARTSAFEPQFFTPHEWRTVHLLVDLVIPADDKSGSATDAAVPEFMDFMMIDGSEARRRTMRQGLEWLDGESTRRFDVAFVDATDAQQRAILDDIAWPARAPEELRSGVTWFNSFRDLTAAGFFSSAMGYADLDYIGNVWVTEWEGCPEPALRKLDVSYDLMEKR